VKNGSWRAKLSQRTNRNFSAAPFGFSAWQALYPGRGASDGVANYEIARRVGVCANTVRKWRRSFPAGAWREWG
jgi:hypothetical protein